MNQPTPPEADAANLIREAEQYATHSLKEFDAVPPALFFNPCAGPPGAYFHQGKFTPRDKELFAQVARLFCAAFDARAALVVCEMYIATVPDLTPEQRAEMKSLADVQRICGLASEAFNRVECLGLWLQTRAGHVMAFREIVRHENRAFVGLAESERFPDMKEKDGWNAEGTFANLLPSENLPQSARELARFGLAMAGIDLGGSGKLFQLPK